MGARRQRASANRGRRRGRRRAEVVISASRHARSRAESARRGLRAAAGQQLTERETGAGSTEATVVPDHVREIRASTRRPQRRAEHAENDLHKEWVAKLAA